METLLTILHHILVAVGVMFLFCLAVVVHEFGHFIAAKWLGFKITTFSVCFGPAIWKKKINGVEYRIGSIPLGGYVALPQLDPSSMDTIQGKNGKDGSENGSEDAPPPPMAAWKRIIVAAAGPLGNVILAVIVAFFIFTFAPDDEFGGYGTTVGKVKSSGAIAESGIRKGDRIVSVNGQKVSFWSEVILECHFAGDSQKGLPVVVNRNGNELNLTLPVEKDEKTGYHRFPGISPQVKCVIADVFPNSAAAKAGLKKDDIVLSINGVVPSSVKESVELVANSGTNTIQMLIRRKGSVDEMTKTLSAVFNEEYNRPVIGVAFADASAGIPQWMMFKRPWQQLSGDAKNIFRILRALFAPKSKTEAGRAAKDMGGPGTLLFVLWNEVQAGLFHSLAFLRFLCINLAILNLLPLPVLDGGHILFAILEIITRKRPSPKLVDVVTTFFAILLLGLMAILLFRDVVRIHKFTKKAPAAEVQSQQNGK